MPFLALLLFFGRGHRSVHGYGGMHEGVAPTLIQGIGRSSVVSRHGHLTLGRLVVMILTRARFEMAVLDFIVFYGTGGGLVSIALVEGVVAIGCSPGVEAFSLHTLHIGI